MREEISKLRKSAVLSEGILGIFVVVTKNEVHFRDDAQGVGRNADRSADSVRVSVVTFSIVVPPNMLNVTPYGF